MLTRRFGGLNGLRSTNGSTPMLAMWERAVRAHLALFGAIGVVVVGSSACDNRVPEESFAKQRAEMVAHIAQNSKLHGSCFGTSGVSANIHDAMRETKAPNTKATSTSDPWHSAPMSLAKSS